MEYPRLGVRIEYKDNKIASVIHTYTVSENLTEDQCLSYTKRHLRLLWELLEYRYGLPIKASNSHIRILGEPRPATGRLEFFVDAALCKEVILPKETILVKHPPRLMAWLRYVNDARNTRSDTEAIRLYYAAWEDMKGKPSQSHPAQATHLKHTRDFVSHGVRLTNPKALEFLKAELGQETNQYNPTDPVHCEFVRRQRYRARELIEAEIERELDI